MRPANDQLAASCMVTELTWRDPRVTRSPSSNVPTRYRTVTQIRRSQSCRRPACRAAPAAATETAGRLFRAVRARASGPGWRTLIVSGHESRQPARAVADGVAGGLAGVVQNRVSLRV